MDLPSLMGTGSCSSIMKNVGIVVDDKGLLGMITERRQKFYKPIDVNSVTNAIGEIELNMIFLVVTFFCG